MNVRQATRRTFLTTAAAGGLAKRSDEIHYRGGDQAQVHGVAAGAEDTLDQAVTEGAAGGAAIAGDHHHALALFQREGAEGAPQLIGKWLGDLVTGDAADVIGAEDVVRIVGFLAGSWRGSAAALS